MIPSDYITEWRAYAPWVQDSHVKQDLILSGALVEIYSHPLLGGARESPADSPSDDPEFAESLVELLEFFRRHIADHFIFTSEGNTPELNGDCVGGHFR